MPFWLELLSEPAALLGWALIALTWLLFHGPAVRAARYLAVGATGFYFVVATPLGANLAVAALELSVHQQERCLSPATDSVIVVLAGGQRGTPTGIDDVARLEGASLSRTIEGTRLALRAPATLLILSGGAGGVYREADLMESLARQLGVAESRIIKDRESMSTADSADNVARWLTATGRNQMAVHLVTSALHMPRAAGTFRRQGLAVCPVLVEHRLVIPAPHEALIPQISALQKSTDAYHEMAGYALYALTGKL
jgi:uncharacterized SAM-binding protein YcdF (DUF218 family)